MKKGLLLVNLGSPDSPVTSDVRKYLREFLMDKRVIDVPYLLRKFIVELIILPRRPRESAKAYSKIWWPEGSPLVVLSKRLQTKVASYLAHPVSLGMRYGSPSIASGLSDLSKKGVKEVLVLPLYPQYAMSTTESVVVKCLKDQKKYFKDIKLSFLPPFYDRKDYIELLSKHIMKQLPSDNEHLLFSYHGLPERHIRKTDRVGHCKIDDQCCKSPYVTAHDVCYRHQCYETTHRVARELKLQDGSFSMSFQSRLGQDPWLKPYTDKTLALLARGSVKKIAVVAPAFVSDCLETLEEIAMEGKKLFMDAGGEQFEYIPCLNDLAEWAHLLAKWSEEELK